MKKYHEYEERPLPRGTITEKILEILSRGAEASGAILSVLASEATNFSMRPNYRGGTSFSVADWAASYRESNSFYALLAKLKRDGFVAFAGKRGSFLWHITPAGRRKLHGLMGVHRLRHPKSRFVKAAPDGRTRIVLYDIPEREREKRFWVYDALGALGYELLQRSAWIGTRPLPAAFFRALREQRILECVHVIEVGKSGTLRHLS